MRFFVVPRWLQRHAPLLIASVLMLAMGISLAWQAADWRRLLRAPTASIKAASPAIKDAPALSLLAMLFGTRSVLAEDAPAPPTQLRLSLRGSFVHADPQRSSAIVQREGKPAERYTIGAEIDEGIRLHAVYHDRIELQRDGRLETLRFPPRNPVQASRAIESPPQTTQADEPLDPLERLPENNAALLRERMDALRQQMEAAGTLPDADPTDLPTEGE